MNFIRIWLFSGPRFFAAWSRFPAFALPSRHITCINYFATKTTTTARSASIFYYFCAMKHLYLPHKIMQAAFIAVLALFTTMSSYANRTVRSVQTTSRPTWHHVGDVPQQGLLGLGSVTHTDLSIYANLEGGDKKAKKPKCETPDLLAPSLTCHVAVLPQESLFGNDALTFLNSAYQTVVTTLPTRLYRAFGGSAMPGGTFVTPDTLADTSQTRKNLAILTEWGNTLEFEAVIKVPVVVKLNIGLAAPQAYLPGLGQQVIMPYKWNTDWIERIYHTRSAQSWSLAEFKAAYPQYFPK
jgi:hypothetical protein